MENVSSERLVQAFSKQIDNIEHRVCTDLILQAIIISAGPRVGHPAVKGPCCTQSLSTVSVYKSQVRCHCTVSVSSVLFPSFNGSPPDPGAIKYPQKKSGSKLAGRAKHYKNRYGSVRGTETLENVCSERPRPPNIGKRKL